mmetsp:Transcript_1913/g.6803  ORF Transcript_1913/g.6803 Transcript_1913/m.6803 type:complete len:408 (+) Transcript_1913:133-1356(+)
MFASTASLVQGAAARPVARARASRCSHMARAGAPAHLSSRACTWGSPGAGTKLRPGQPALGRLAAKKGQGNHPPGDWGGENQPVYKYVDRLKDHHYREAMLAEMYNELKDPCILEDIAEEDVIMPVFPGREVKFPSEKMCLRLMEPKWKICFDLVAKRPAGQRHFVYCLSDALAGTMSEVGVLCELVEYDPNPADGQPGVIVTAEAVSRVRLQAMVADRPFTIACVEPIVDTSASYSSDSLSHEALEASVVNHMASVRDLAERLYGQQEEDVGPMGDETVVRWLPEGAEAVQMLRRQQRGRAYEVETPREVEAKEHDECLVVPGGSELLMDWSKGSQLVAADGPSHIRRRSQLSFAVLRTMDLSSEQQQEMLASTDVARRLLCIEEAISYARNYLLAQNAIKGCFIE